MGRVCPFWVGYFLINPFRKLLHDPVRIVGPYVQQGMTALDVGPGMGYFSIPMAELVGPQGKVVCVDLQEKMLRVLMKRAAKRGLADRIVSRTCGDQSLGLEDLAGQVDFALAFAVVHEVPDASAFFSQVHAALKPQGKLLLAEPRGHVREWRFNEEGELACRSGFTRISEPQVPRCRCLLLQRPS